MSAYINRNAYVNIERLTGSNFSGEISSDVVMPAVPVRLQRNRSSVVNGEGMFISVDAQCQISKEHGEKVLQGDFVVPLPKKNENRFRVELIDEVMDITGKIIYFSMQLRKYIPYEEES